MPDRLIREGIKTSARIGRVSERAEMLFVRLLVTVCPYGRYHAEPELVKQGALPNRPRIRTADVSAALDELERSGLISRWTVPDGAAYLVIPKFGQRLKFKGRSPYPAPPHVPDTPGQEVIAFAEDEPPPNQKKRREESVAREARDTRHAENCLDELRKRWPRHDVDACLRRAKLYVGKQRGAGAIVTVTWFESHWMPNEAEADHETDAPNGTLPEPTGWRQWCVANAPDFAGMTKPWRELDQVQQRFISERMRASA